jgi:hypothetical protein
MNRISFFQFLLPAICLIGSADSFSADSVFNTINLKFRETYDSARTQQIEKCRAIVIASNDQLVLLTRFQGGQWKRKVSALKMDNYHLLKTIAHVPATLFLLFKGQPLKPVSSEFLASLSDFKRQLSEGWTELNKKQLLSEGKVHSQLILERSIQWINEVLRTSNFDPKILTHLIQTLEPSISVLISHSITTQIEALDHVVSEWKRLLAHEEWNKLRVVVLGVPQANRENLLVQYFQRLLNVKDDRARIVYGENLSTEAGALRLLGTVLLDRGMSEMFFHKSRAYEQDILGDGARIQLAL